MVPGSQVGLVQAAVKQSFENSVGGCGHEGLCCRLASACKSRDNLPTNLVHRWSDLGKAEHSYWHAKQYMPHYFYKINYSDVMLLCKAGAPSF